MRQTFPYKCARCGMCCIVNTCVHAKQRGCSEAPCKFLRMDARGATCELFITLTKNASNTQGQVGYSDVAEAFGIEAGCCISAKAVDKLGTEHDFAALPPKTKRSLAMTAYLANIKGLET